MSVKALWLLLLMLIITGSARSQTPSEVRIDPQKPTVYFTAERLTGENLWLSLHNNSRWAVSFRTEGAPGNTISFRLPDGREAKTLVDGAEISPRYDIVNLWTGGWSEYSCGETEVWLAPGTSALMSVRVERLKPMAYFYVSINYEWEGELERTEHRVCFRYVPELKVPDSN